MQEISGTRELVTLNSDIIRKKDFKWNLNVNFSKNVNIYNLIIFDRIRFVGYEGKRYGVILGTKYARVEDPSSPFYGKKILDKQGLPTSDGKEYVLGDQTLRALLGIVNGFTVKNVGISFQVDGRFGGKFFSGTKMALKRAGLDQETVVNGGRESFIVDGVIAINPTPMYMNLIICKCLFLNRLMLAKFSILIRRFDNLWKLGILFSHRRSCFAWVVNSDIR